MNCNFRFIAFSDVISVFTIDKKQWMEIVITIINPWVQTKITRWSYRVAHLVSKRSRLNAKTPEGMLKLHHFSLNLMSDISDGDSEENVAVSEEVNRLQNTDWYVQCMGIFVKSCHKSSQFLHVNHHKQFKIIMYIFRKYRYVAYRRLSRWAWGYMGRKYE